MKPDKDSEWYMGGTDGSGEYIVVAQGVHGRVGYRTLGDEGVRVRIEPNTTALVIQVEPQSRFTFCPSEC